MMRFYPGRSHHQLCRFKTYQQRQLRRLHRTNISVSSQEKFQEIKAIVHARVRKGDHVGLLIMAVPKWWLFSQLIK